MCSWYNGSWEESCGQTLNNYTCCKAGLQCVRAVGLQECRTNPFGCFTVDWAKPAGEVVKGKTCFFFSSSRWMQLSLYEYIRKELGDWDYISCNKCLQDSTLSLSEAGFLFTSFFFFLKGLNKNCKKWDVVLTHFHLPVEVKSDVTYKKWYFLIWQDPQLIVRREKGFI